MRAPVATLAVRSDPAGDGAFGAPRGQRLHLGVDLELMPGWEVLAPVSGHVTRIGVCYDPHRYPGRAHLRLLEMDGRLGPLRVRTQVLYVLPTVEAGAIVHEGEMIGLAQDVAAVHGGGMRPHIHWQIEILGALAHPGREARCFIDPLTLL